MLFKKSPITPLLGAALLAAIIAPLAIAQDQNSDSAVIYLTRHAEKLTVQTSEGADNCAPDKKGTLRCEEALNPAGEERAQALAKWFEENDIIDQVTHVISSDKQRTRQTIVPTAQKVKGLPTDTADGIDDGVMQLPADAANSPGNELTSNGKSVGPMAAAIMALPAGSVAVVAAHSGTIYKILGGSDTDGNPATGDDDTVGLGIDTTVGDNYAEDTLFPKKEADGKVRVFGDLWKIVINAETKEAQVEWRKSL